VNVLIYWCSTDDPSHDVLISVAQAYSDPRVANDFAPLRLLHVSLVVASGVVLDRTVAGYDCMLTRWSLKMSTLVVSATAARVDGWHVRLPPLFTDVHSSLDERGTRHFLCIYEIAADICDVQGFYSRFYNVKCQTITGSLYCRFDAIFRCNCVNYYLFI